VPLAGRGRGGGRGTVAIRLNSGYDPVIVIVTLTMTLGWVVPPVGFRPVLFLGENKTKLEF